MTNEFSQPPQITSDSNVSLLAHASQSAASPNYQALVHLQTAKAGISLAYEVFEALFTSK